MITEQEVNSIMDKLFATYGKGSELGIDKNRWNQYKIQHKKGRLSLGKKLEILNLADKLDLV